MKPIDKIYNLRNKFSVIALTGVTGSGCSELANIMAESFDELKTKIRNDKEFQTDTYRDAKQYQVFKRKYFRAYRFVEKKQEKYTIISYKNALILETLILLVKTKEDVIHRFAAVVNDKFHPSCTDIDYNYSNLNLTEDLLRKWGIEEIVNEIQKNISKLNDENWNNSKGAWRSFVNSLFFDKKFVEFCDSLYEYLKHNDYYLKNLFVHRLANSIRSFGNPELVLNRESKKDVTMKNMFLIVGLINDIIKGSDHSSKRNFVVDSVRCSLEIVYLRERYNAFYMICMHNEKCIDTIKNKVEAYNNDGRQSVITESIYDLGITENDPKSYEEGLFSVPDIYNCIGNSEIHIFKRENDKEPHLDFYSTAEQWLKIQALILHPGLFTPSSDERCMSIAFQVKYNSGCISRQVGCVITDDKYTIKSVGWNDVPVGQIPCGLSDARELCDSNYEKDDPNNRCYSKFEYKGMITCENHKSVSFLQKMKETYPLEVTNRVEQEGLYTPFCFKKHYNDFKGPKDNVNTRSLHAEENTMLQISKNGGAGLNGGRMYVTASPCVLCSKKAYQIGIKEIIYLDRYTDIAEDQILDSGYDKPICRGFCGLIGATYFKLYQPFMSFKDELQIRMKES